MPFQPEAATVEKATKPIEETSPRIPEQAPEALETSSQKLPPHAAEPAIAIIADISTNTFL